MTTEDKKYQAATLLAQEGWSKEDIDETLSMDSEACHVCGKAATLLCDGKLPRWRNGDRQLFAAKLRKKGMRYPLASITCDRPLCSDCAISDDRIFFWHGSGEDGEPTGGARTFDYCPECASYKPELKKVRWDK